MNDDDKHIFEEDMLVSRNPMIESYSIISLHPNVPNNWKGLFEQEDPIIGTHENTNCPPLDVSPLCDDTYLQHLTMKCDEPLESSPTRVDIIAQDNEIMDKNQISPSPNISPIIEDDIMVLQDPIDENPRNLMEQDTSTIARSPNCDEVILKQPILEIQEHLDFFSPTNSPPMNTIMVQENDMSYSGIHETKTTKVMNAQVSIIFPSINETHTYLVGHPKNPLILYPPSH